MVDTSLRRELQKKAQTLKPVLNIGKAGITPTVIGEISKQLKKHKLIKVKLLKNVDEDRKEVAQLIAEKTEATLISVVGSVITLHKG